MPDSKPAVAENELQAAASKLKHAETEVHTHLPTKEEIEAEKKADEKK
eukprot:CAMPEP_0185155794 /NCGR_PEP_ID=MMETSP1139-20130426/669_1 /TAXON_ID=298111 /ORGANISM="Pavlova sp., Strain CCMP459" /LENGTH=47 /DNA_ID= /DNA_START= /DNA_END= /DNA_ORIENTATION=